MGAGRKRTADEIRRDRLEVSRLSLLGWKQSEIAEQMRVTQQQVSYDMKKIREDWLQRTRQNFDVLRSEQVAYLEILESEAWEAWQNSKKPKVIKQAHEKRLTDGKAESVKMQREESSVGDPRFLSELRSLAHDKSELLGIITTKPTILIQLGITEPMLRQLGEIAEAFETTPADILNWFIAEARREEREGGDFLISASN